ncbi:hypothetical protein COOONC_20081, partial [Cooperia oncophora]
TVDSDRHSTTREIAEKLHVSHTCIENHLKQLGYVQKLDTWKRNENDPFLKRLITGDEKWVAYNNFKRKRAWNGENFNNDDDVKSHLIQFFANKNQKFYERGIMMLPERWQKVIDKNGQYITE